MDQRLEKLKGFLDNKNNWRPPSYTQIMKFMGWTSKNSVAKALIQLKKQSYENQES